MKVKPNKISLFSLTTIKSDPSPVITDKKSVTHPKWELWGKAHYSRGQW